MIDDLPLRWAVTGLFLLSAVGFVLVVDRRSWTSVVSYGLHLTMAIAMAVMAWPQGLGLPPTPAEAFFLAAALWFVIMAVLATRMGGMRLLRGYHALKMLAMAWMYAVVHHQPLPEGLGAGHQHHHHHHEMPPDQPMPDIEMTPDMNPGMTPGMTPAAAPADDWPGWVDVGNWGWALLFVVAAAVWGYRYVAQRRVARRRRSRRWRTTLGAALQAMMAAGTAIMFGALLLQG
ncbi:DUF5134 domain-containing protein [Mycobacterium asiaticum]|uniref:DUF5134 domain-containing protein n=1 Tax=Mycobacterium asiaticum TaxID=1790 RepID=UPI00056D9063|nr:DUF5134 domain-containing protein [Mycobacterium asiaticum]ORA14723.1 DUF5134 domain-containing protein [Mycobacterium asiaticum DSM 44297]